ncbi:hypothetical protein [Vibrio phage XZ1]|nr:hypothetical protein [Vibrio phage XZ1]
MKNLKSFMEELQLVTEVFIRGGRPRNGSKVLANGKNIWVWNNDREFERLVPFINRELGTDFEEEYDLDDWYREGAQAVYATIENGRLDMFGDSAYRPSVTSDTLRKTIKALNLNGVTRRTQSFNPDYDEVEHDFETDRYEFNKKLSQKTFYHGTSTAYIESMLKFGLKPNPGETQFDNIEHADKVFITTELDKAMFHATHSANRNNSFPVIIEIRIPDESKLVSDYDVVIDVLGANSEEASELGYADIFYQLPHQRGDGTKYHKDDIESRFGKRLGGLSTRIGVFGYKGRIPASHFNFIYADGDVIEESMPEMYWEMDGEFDMAEMRTETVNHRSFDYWDQYKPEKFIAHFEELWDDLADEFEDDDDDY